MTDELINSSNGENFLPIFLDTNFLMALGQFTNFNISSELDRVIPRSRQLIVLEPIFQEIQKLYETGNPKTKIEAKLALDFVEKYCIIRSSPFKHRNVDFILLFNSEKENGIIATNDNRLKKMARNKQIKTLYIRNKRILELR
ncbi:type II toxin-antitoxin system VapC family toxin [Candidatus Hodarchaeum mangrovi]